MRPVAVAAIIICEKQRHATEVTVGTVAPLIVAAAAVDQDMVGLVVSKVSRDNGIFAIICVR